MVFIWSWFENVSLFPENLWNYLIRLKYIAKTAHQIYLGQMDNAAEGSGNKLYFNKPWFTGQDRWENHKDDIEFFIFHELRHLHQHYEIALADNHTSLHESKETVSLWKNGFVNYTRNDGGDTQLINVSQEVEIDANAYALCLSNLLHMHDDAGLYFSVPEEQWISPNPEQSGIIRRNRN